MSIISEVQELDSIEKEIKRLSTTLRDLRKRKRYLEETISGFLDKHGEKGVKYQGKAIVAHKKEKVIRKKQSERESDLYHVLQKYVRDPERVMGEVLEAQKGNKTETTTLKIKNIKKR